MAVLLKNTNDIVTLQVELAAADQVVATLQFLDNGKLRSQSLWRGDVAEFGLVAAGRTAAWWKSAQPGVPSALSAQLVPALAELQASGGADYRALWIHLLKPYGVLRFVPWERDLAAVQELPVLMLPDFIFPPPRESAAQLEIALCVSAPLDAGHSALIDDLVQAIAAIEQGVDRPFRLHVFAAGEISQRLRDSALLPAYCLLHSPADAAAYVAPDLSSRRHDRSGSLRSPWLLWMRDALRSYSTDVVHFVVHGHLAGQAGALLMAQSPLQRSDNYLAGPVGGIELASFLTQVGAWSTMFTSAQHNHNPLGLRALADEIAQTLPGPMMLFDPRFGGVQDLAAGYRFIHSPSAAPVPRTAALYLYCQPYLLTQRQGGTDDTPLAASLRVQIEQFARNDSQRDTALRSLGIAPAAAAPNEVPLAAPAGKSISAVTAATERLAEQLQVQYQKLLRDEVVPEAIALRDLDSAMETVNQMREAVSKMEQQRLLGEIGTGLDRIESLSGESISAAMEIIRDVSASSGFDKNLYIKAIDTGGFDKGIFGNVIGDAGLGKDAFGKIVDFSGLGRAAIAKGIEADELYKDGFQETVVPAIDSTVADIFRVETSWGQLHQLAASRPDMAGSVGAIDLGRIEARITTLETRLHEAAQGLAPAADPQRREDDDEESA